MPYTSKKSHREPRDGKTREKICVFCRDKNEPKWNDYEALRGFLSARGRILSRSISFVCVKHQRKLAQAIKQARHLALLPFITNE